MTLTPGQEALHEAARLEASRVYGRVVRESTEPVGLAALIAEAELRARHVDNAVHKPVKKPVGRPSKRDAAPSTTEPSALGKRLIDDAVRSGRTTKEIVDAYNVDYATVRAARKRVMRRAG